jgi:hypothetical protein
VSMQRYRFGEPTHRGPLGAVRTGQLALTAAGLVWAIAIIDIAPTPPGVLVAFSGLAGAILTVTVPVGGRTLEQWLPVALAWLQARITRKDTEVAGSAGAGGTVTFASGRALVRDREPSPPVAVRGVRIVAVPYRGGQIGAVSERHGRRLTAVLVSRAPGFALADHEEQQQRLAAWATVLGGCAHGPVRRVGWVQRTAPAQGDGLARWLHEQHDPEIPQASRITQSYLELMAHSAQAVCEHEVLLCVQVDAGRLRHADGAHTLADSLLDSCERLAAGLEGARVRTDRALSPGGLARALRVSYDPYQHAQIAALRAAGASDELTERHAWPTATCAHWGSYRADGAYHATFEIGGWPRSDVGPAFLAPLLETAEQVRAVAVWFEPLDPRRSLRQAEVDITRQETDRRQRQRFGQIDTARQQQAQDATRRREQELAAGHSEVRIAGYVTVTGHGPDELERACEQTITLAARSHLELHRLYGQQAQAFTFTLPLCRGLK